MLTLYKIFYTLSIFELVKSRVGIYEVISCYLKLIKRGDSYLACCPFHQEKTPSLNINTKKNVFYCFGCQVGGDVIVFVAKYHNISTKDAVDKLAAQFNISLPVYQVSSKYDGYLNLLQKIAEYYHSHLTIRAIEYLESRKINSYLREVFMIGYSMSIRELIKRDNLSEVDCLELGMLKRSQYGRDTYDFFRDRIIFPIINNKNKVIGFGGRVFNNTSKIAKYINSNESVIFKKREVFYGEAQAWNYVKDLRQVYIVEGYLDCIRMYQFGYFNTLSTSGTAFTYEQAQRLLLVANEVRFCFDADIAGGKAVEKCLDIICEIVSPDMNFVFINLPEGNDPDSFLMNNSQEIFDNLKSLSYMDMIFHLVEKKYQDLGMLHHQLTEYSKRFKNQSIKYKFDMQIKDFLWKYYLKSKKSSERNYLTVKSIADGMFNSGFVAKQFSIISNTSAKEGMSGNEYILMLSIICIIVYHYQFLMDNSFLETDEYSLLKDICFIDSDLGVVKKFIIECMENGLDVLKLVKSEYLIIYNKINAFYHDSILANNIVDDIILNIKIYIIKYCIAFYTNQYTKEDQISNDLIDNIRYLNMKLIELEKSDALK